MRLLLFNLGEIFMSYRILHSNVIYEGKVLKVRQDQVSLPNGRQSKIDVVEHEPSVAIIPVDDLGQVWLIEQLRYPVGGDILELPAGVVEKSESPVDTAHREIQEEIGMAARSLQLVCEFYLAPGYSSEYMYVYLAQDLYPSSLDQDEDEFIKVVKIPFQDAFEMAERGRFRDAKTIAGLLIAKNFLSSE